MFVFNYQLCIRSPCYSGRFIIILSGRQPPEIYSVWYLTLFPLAITFSYVGLPFAPVAHKFILLFHQQAVRVFVVVQVERLNLYQWLIHNKGK